MPGFKEIGEILSIIDSSNCEEVVLETQEIKLVVNRHGAGRKAAESAAQVAPAAAAPVATTAPAPDAPSQPAAPVPVGPAETEPGSATVRAPMVGTFYRAPSPDAPPFVEPGSTVSQGDPLCVIEVMKLFTTIHAETAGVIESIGAENAQLVEYGQVLFTIKAG